MASPFRSTVPLLALVKDAWLTFQEILTHLGVTTDVVVAFERTVQSPRKVGRPSYTDAMVLSSGRAIAIEAKWTEPRYPSVANRLSRNSNSNGNSVEFLNGWIDLLQPHATRPIRLEEFSSCVYQVLHRAASACGEGRTPTLAYCHFAPAPNPAMTNSHYIRDLEEVHDVLGRPQDFPFFHVHVPISPTQHFSAIEGLKKGDPNTGRVVKSALCNRTLFSFGKPIVHRIGKVPDPVQS